MTRDDLKNLMTDLSTKMLDDAIVNLKISLEVLEKELSLEIPSSSEKIFKVCLKALIFPFLDFIAADKLPEEYVNNVILELIRIYKLSQSKMDSDIENPIIKDFSNKTH